MPPNLGPQEKRRQNGEERRGDERREEVVGLLSLVKDMTVWGKQMRKNDYFSLFEGFSLPCLSQQKIRKMQNYEIVLNDEKYV